MIALLYEIQFHGNNDYVYILKNDNGLFLRLLAMGFSAALGQAFIYLTIGAFDCVILTTITTTRKFLTVFLSNVTFNHNFTQVQWIGAFLVLGSALTEPLSKYCGKAKVE